MTTNQSLNNLKTKYFQSDINAVVTSDVKNSISDSERLYGMGKNVITEGQPRGSSTEHLLNMGATIKPDSPNEGDLWNDSELKTLFFYSNSMAQSISTVIFANQIPVHIMSNAVPQHLIETDGFVTIPANYLAIGKILRITAKGFFTYGGDPYSALDVNTKLGSWTDNTIYNISGSSIQGAVDYECTITTQIAGVNGILSIYEKLSDSFGGGTLYIGTKNLDTTIDNNLEVNGTFTMVSASIYLDIFSLIIESLN